MPDSFKNLDYTPQLRILHLLEMLSRDVIRGLKIHEIEEVTGWNRSAISRDLVKLKEAGYVRKDEHFCWKLSSTWHAIAVRYSQQMSQAQQTITETLSSVQARANQL